MSYLNNAATTALKPETVKTAGPATIKDVQERMAKLVKCKNPENIVMTSSGNEAIRAAVLSFVKPGDHVISTDIEYKAVLDALTEAGCEVTFIPVNVYGKLKYELIEDAVRENTKAIVCCHGSNVTGNITDLDLVGTIARRHKLMVIADAAQTVGATEIDMETLQLDVLCFTGHKKLMGPYGTGGVCLRQGLQLDPEVVEKVVNTPSEEKLGQLAAALDFIFEKGQYGVAMLPHRLAKRFFEATKSMTDVTVYGDFGTNVRVPNVTINVKGHTAEEVKNVMRKNHIAVKAGTFDAPRLAKSLGIEENGAVRFSFGYFNTRMEVNDAIWVLMQIQGLTDLHYLA